MLNNANKSKQQLCDRYGISEQFADLLIDLRFLKPTFIDKNMSFDADDELRLEVVLKGQEFGFTLKEIAFLIREQAPSLDGVTL